MKRVFYILILVLAINFVSPNSQAFSQRLRHIIEYNYDDKKRRLKGNDAARNRAIIYLKLHMIQIRIEQINCLYLNNDLSPFTKGGLGGFKKINNGIAASLCSSQ